MSYSRLLWCCLIVVAGCGRCCDEPTAVSKTDGAESTAAAKADCPTCCEVDRSKLVALLMAAADDPPAKGDWPMYGGGPHRNMVNLVEKNIPTDWAVEEGKQKNIKWVAALGSKAYGGPVIADGKIFVGTNNDAARDPAVKGKRAVLMAFNETDGKYLWQITHEFPTDELFHEAIPVGLCSTPAVDGKRLYYVTPGCDVICAGTDGKVQWRCNMMKELKVVPYHCSNCSPLIVGDLVLIVTGNGVGQDGKVASPKAPSFVAFNKTSGKIVWQSDLPGNDIIEGQWSNPTFAKVNGKDQVIFPGGDSCLYGLELATGKMIWKMNCQPERPKADERNTTTPYMIATPVVHDNKAYIALGVYPGGHPSQPPFSHVLCVDLTKTGDASPKTLDAKDPKNKDSALVWSYGGKVNPQPKKGRRVHFGSSISTCAVHDGLVYISEENGYLHCLDAKTGQKYWDYDFKAGIWGSPYYVGGKIYIGTEDGELVIFTHGKVQQVLAKIDMGDTVHSTPVAANGVLYVMTKSKLYAIAEKK